MTNKEFKLQMKLILTLIELKQYEKLEELIRDALEEEQ